MVNFLPADWSILASLARAQKERGRKRKGKKKRAFGR